MNDGSCNIIRLYEGQGLCFPWIFVLPIMLIAL